MSIYKKWNRSSAFSPEIIGALNTATNMAVQSAIQTFDHAFDTASLTEEQRADAYRLLAEGVAEGIDEFAEKLKR